MDLNKSCVCELD